ncbi:unnamed protein product, partial [marine sediment metagenome]
MRASLSITMSGLPGKMASLVAETIKKKENGFYLKGDALTGLNQPKNCKISNYEINLIPPEQHQEYLSLLNKDIDRSIEVPIIVDFSQPDAINKNAELYCKYNIPFVMGTTGGDREVLERVVEESGNKAVIAPNMAKPIVLLQSMCEYASKNFPNAFEGFEMAI